MSGHSRSLAHQVIHLEEQLVQRRRRIRTLATGIKRRVTGRMVSPGVLIAAVGVGVALEQSSRDKGWSPAIVFDAANESLRLLLSFKSPDTTSG